MREGRKKEASKVKQTTRQRNTAHPLYVLQSRYRRILDIHALSAMLLRTPTAAQFTVHVLGEHKILLQCVKHPERWLKIKRDELLTVIYNCSL